MNNNDNYYYLSFSGLCWPEESRKNIPDHYFAIWSKIYSGGLFLKIFIIHMGYCTLKILTLLLLNDAYFYYYFVTIF